MTMEAVQDWTNWLAGTRRLSLATVEGYSRELKSLATKFPSLDAMEFKTKHLNQHLAERRLMDNVGEATVKRAVAAYKSFFGYVCGKKSPARDMPYPRVPRKIQKSLTWEEFQAIACACNTRTAKGARDLAIICLLIDTGLRASELCNLRLADVDLQRGWLKAIVKGGDEGVGLFTEYTTLQLAAWLSVRQTYANDETLFVSLRGGKRLTRQGLKCELRKLGTRAGVVGLCPHRFRRAFASLTTENGGPSRLVQDGGRWGSEAVFRLYSQYARLDGLRPFLPTARMTEAS